MDWSDDFLKKPMDGDKDPRAAMFAAYALFVPAFLFLAYMMLGK
jgi:hypothetical protein